MENEILTVAKKVSEYYGITLSEINMKTRKVKYLEPRQMAHKLCCDLLIPKYTLTRIGLIIGNKKHETVIHSRNEVSNRIETESKSRNDYYFLYSSLKKKFDSLFIKEIEAKSNNFEELISIKIAKYWYFEIYPKTAPINCMGKLAEYIETELKSLNLKPQL